MQPVLYTTLILATRAIYNLDTYNPCHIQPGFIQPEPYTTWIHPTRSIFKLNTFNPRHINILRTNLINLRDYWTTYSWSKSWFKLTEILKSLKWFKKYKFPKFPRPFLRCQIPFWKAYITYIIFLKTWHLFIIKNKIRRIS